MPSFDVTLEANQVEIRNAVDQANKEITNRFDFKGSDARFELADKALTAFADDDFNEIYMITIGVDFRFKSLNINQKIVKMQIWDTAGQERFRTIVNTYYKSTIPATQTPTPFFSSSTSPKCTIFTL